MMRGKKILDNIFSDTGEFAVRFVFAVVFMSFFITNCFGQNTFTDEEMINLENDFIYLENKIDSSALGVSVTLLINQISDVLNVF